MGDLDLLGLSMTEHAAEVIVGLDIGCTGAIR